jgi:hypothetical protein
MTHNKVFSAGVGRQQLAGGGEGWGANFLDCINSEEFCDQLNNYQLLKKDSAP